MTNEPYEFNYTKISIIEDGHYDLTEPFWQNLQDDLENQHSANVVLAAMNHAVNFLTTIVGAADEAFLKSKYGAAFQFIMKAPGAAAEITLQTSWDESNEQWKVLIVETGEEFIETSFNVATGTALGVAAAALIPAGAGVVTTLAIGAAGYAAGEILSKVYDNYIEENIKNALETILEQGTLETDVSLGLGNGTTENYKVNTSQTINAIINAMGVDFTYLESTNPNLSENLITLPDSTQALIYQDDQPIDITPPNSNRTYELLSEQTSYVFDNPTADVGVNSGKHFVLVLGGTEPPDDLDQIFTDPATGEFIGGFRYTDDLGDEQNLIKRYHNLEELAEELKIDGFEGPQPLYYVPPTEEERAFMFSSDENTKANVGGESYFLSDVLDSIGEAGTAVATFVSEQVNEFTEWFKSDGVNAIQLDIANWLAGNLGDLIDGNISTEQAFIDLAEYVAAQRITGYVLGTIETKTEAKATLAEMYADAGAVGDANILAEATFTALSQMAVQFALDSEGWNSTQYANAGISIISSALAYEYTKSFYGAGAWASGAAAATATVVRGLLESSDYNSSDWAFLGVQASIATGSAVGGTLAAEAIIGASISTGNPAVIAAAAVLTAVSAIVGGKLVSSIYSGKKFYAGEYGDKGALLNSIYQIQDIETGEVDGNGDPITVQALVASNSSGSTILLENFNGITYGIGREGSDIIVGTDTADVMSGGAGSDYIEGKEGDEQISGDEGNDHLIGAEGDDVIQGGDGDDIIFGDAGEDTILGGDGDDFIHGGGDSDAILGGLGRDTILASGGDDVVQGDAGDDMIDGGYGDDLLDGGEGDDILLGNLGNDSITAGDGDDKVFGDVGNDRLMGGAGADYLNGGEGVDILEGGNGDDLIHGDAGDDYLQGDLGNDDLGGGFGNDVILGGLDNDYLWGQEGDDDLDGGDGDDILIGGLGADALAGATGSDVYVLQADDSGLFGNDTITDISGENDRVYINGLDSTNESNLGLTRDGDNLLISFNAVTIATVAGYFASGPDSIEKIEFDTDKFIDLSAVTYDGVTGVGTFTSSTDANQITKADIDLREADIDANLQLQSQFWNNAFLQNLSETAYEEALRDEFESEYYNGSDITEFKRSRGKFGGHYKVYKLQQSDTLDGGTSLISYNKIEVGEDTSSYDEVLDGQSVVSTVTMSFDISYYGWGVFDSDIELTDIYMDNSYIDTLFSYQDGDGNEVTISMNDYLSDLDSNISVTLSHDVNQRLNIGISENTSFGKTITESGSDHLVGSWWDETINGYSGSDAIFGGDGDDTINGGAGDDWLFGGDGDDIINSGTGNDVSFGGGDDDYIYGAEGEDTLVGSSGDDNLYGEDGSDWIVGGEGEDFIRGDLGDDIIFGGVGNDTIYGDEGADVIHGDSGDDILYGKADNDYVYGGFGNDILGGGYGDDYLYGNEGNDNLNGGKGDDHLDGGDGYDVVDYSNQVTSLTVDMTINSITGANIGTDTYSNIEVIETGSLADTIIGDASNTEFRGNAGDDNISAGDGDDYLIGGAGADTLDGGAGNDRVGYANSNAAIILDLSTQTVSGGTATGDIISNIESAVGSIYDDSLSGDSESNYFYGEDGADTLIGLANKDYFTGGSGNDLLQGGADNDYYYFYEGHGMDIIDDESGSETVIFGSDMMILDVQFAQSGNDLLLTYGLNDQITLQNHYGSIDNFVEKIYFADHGSSFYLDNLHFGTDAKDTIYGDTQASNVIYSLEQADTTYGYAGNDVIYGGIGNDTIYGGTKKDYLFGGEGTDWIYGETGNDEIHGGDKTDYLYGGEGHDTIYGDLGNDEIHGEVGNDTIHGGEGHDLLEGNAGNDFIYGGGHHDTIYGNEGSDELFGDAGDDILIGGEKDDILTGGAGYDIFVFENVSDSSGSYIDTITDFDIVRDKIDVTAFNIEFADFTITDEGTNTSISHTNGFELKLEGIYTLTENEFIFV